MSTFVGTMIRQLVFYPIMEALLSTHLYATIINNKKLTYTISFCSPCWTRTSDPLINSQML